MPLRTKEAGSYSHLHYSVFDWMQILDVFNSFPLTVEAAAAMGLIDCVKPKLDAIHYITHHTCGQAAAAQPQLVCRIKMLWLACRPVSSRLRHILSCQLAIRCLL